MSPNLLDILPLKKLFQPIFFCSSSASWIPQSLSSLGTSRLFGSTSLSCIQSRTASNRIWCKFLCVFCLLNHLCNESQHLSVICAFCKTLHRKKCWAVSTQPQFNGNWLSSFSSLSSVVAWLDSNLCFCSLEFCQSNIYLIALICLWMSRPFMARPNASQCTNLNVSRVHISFWHIKSWSGWEVSSFHMTFSALVVTAELFTMIAIFKEVQNGAFVVCNMWHVCSASLSIWTFQNACLWRGPSFFCFTMKSSWCHLANNVFHNGGRFYPQVKVSDEACLWCVHWRLSFRKSLDNCVVVNMAMYASHFYWSKFLF